MKPSLFSQAFPLTPLEELHSYLQDALSSVNALIIDRLDSSVPLIPKLAQHLIMAGGKRLRPLLTLACYKLCSKDFNHYLHEAVLLAAAVEFIHSATLLHDDVVDMSLTRRSHPTANALWGNSASVLVGDFLFSKAFELMVATGNLDVLKVLSKASSTISEGEVLQLTQSFSLDVDYEICLKIIEAKTATLFSAACEGGSLLSKPLQEKVILCRKFGLYLGMVFQIVDDILDYTANIASIGKKPGSDFYEGKVTLPLLLTYQKASPEDSIILKQLFEEKKSFEEVISLLTKYDSFNQSLELAKQYSLKAKECLTSFENTSLKTMLLDLCDYCLERTY